MVWRFDVWFTLGLGFELPVKFLLFVIVGLLFVVRWDWLFWVFDCICFGYVWVVLNWFVVLRWLLVAFVFDDLCLLCWCVR